VKENTDYILNFEYHDAFNVHNNLGLALHNATDCPQCSQYSLCYDGLVLELSDAFDSNTFANVCARWVVISTASGARSSAYTRTNDCRMLVRSPFSVSRINVSRSRVI